FLLLFLFFSFLSPLNLPKNLYIFFFFNTVTLYYIPFAIFSFLLPVTPHLCVRSLCGFRFSSSSSPTRSLRSFAVSSAILFLLL
ncbi:hypothetical protein FRA28_28515, partial [Escherichia coli]